MAIRSTFTTGEVLTAADLTDTIKGAFINTETTTSRTLGTADAGNLVTLNNNSGGTVTIPSNTTWGSPLGTLVHLINIGTAGSFTVGTAAGVTLNAASATLAIQEGGMLIKTATNTWQFVKQSQPPGLAFITGTTYTSSSGVNVNGCFSSTYLAYRLILAISSSDGLGFTMRMRVGGADDTSTQYRLQQITADGATLTSVRPAAGTSWSLGASANPELFTWDLIDPAVAAATRASHITSATSGGDPQLRVRYLIHSVSTAYDGFSLTPSTAGQTISGSVRVYGYRNS